MRPGAIVPATSSTRAPHGWTFVREVQGEGYWRRPGARTDGIDATTNYNDSDLFYVFSTSTEFENERSYSKFAAFALLNFNNDFEAAARDLAARGYESRDRYEMRAR